jgi:hypothetical protein
VRRLLERRVVAAQGHDEVARALVRGEPDAQREAAREPAIRVQDVGVRGELGAGRELADARRDDRAQRHPGAHDLRARGRELEPGAAEHADLHAPAERERQQRLGLDDPERGDAEPRGEPVRAAERPEVAADPRERRVDGRSRPARHPVVEAGDQREALELLDRRDQQLAVEPEAAGDAVDVEVRWAADRHQHLQEGEQRRFVGLGVGADRAQAVVTGPHRQRAVVAARLGVAGHEQPAADRHRRDVVVDGQPVDGEADVRRVLERDRGLQPDHLERHPSAPHARAEPDPHPGEVEVEVDGVDGQRPERLPLLQRVRRLSAFLFRFGGRELHLYRLVGESQVSGEGGDPVPVRVRQFDVDGLESDRRVFAGVGADERELLEVDEERLGERDPRCGGDLLPAAPQARRAHEQRWEGRHRAIDDALDQPLERRRQVEARLRLGLEAERARCALDPVRERDLVDAFHAGRTLSAQRARVNSGSLER